jgi:hypothetical protein
MPKRIRKWKYIYKIPKTIKILKDAQEEDLNNIVKNGLEEERLESIKGILNGFGGEHEQYAVAYIEHLTEQNDFLRGELERIASEVLTCGESIEQAQEILESASLRSRRKNE